MLSNLENYRKDLERLVEKGNLLLYAIQYECYPEQFKETIGYYVNGRDTLSRIKRNYSFDHH